MVGKWKEPWRLYSKGIRVANLELSFKDKAGAWTLLCMLLIFIQFLMYLACQKVSL